MFSLIKGITLQCLLHLSFSQFICPSNYSVGTMTGYDNQNTSDDPNAFMLDNTQVNADFLKNVPVVAVNQPDWGINQYHNIQVIRNDGQQAMLQIWDLCSNTDCSLLAGVDCCTKNAKAYGGDFLVDVEARTLIRLFQLNNYAEVNEQICYKVLDSFQPNVILATYNIFDVSPVSSSQASSLICSYSIPFCIILIHLFLNL